MGQLTVYMDNDTLKRIGAAAKREGESISRWVKKRLLSAFRKTWPEGYFDLFGSLKDERFERPKQGHFSQDTRRAKL